MLTKRALFVLSGGVAIFILLGCAPPRFVIPDAMTEADYAQDLQECEYKARLLYRESIGIPFVIGHEGIDSAIIEEWKRCMELKGYRYIQE